MLPELARALDPAILLEDWGFKPDPWQEMALRSTSRRMLLMCGRQMGKSTTTAGIALHEVFYRPGAMVLLLAPSQRQSGELFLKVLNAYRALDRPVPPVREMQTSLELANGSRIVCLPGEPATIRGFSAASLVVVDEAALVPDDELFVSVMPMLAVSKGRLLLLSTPYGKRGFFYTQWTGGDPTWERIRARASECPRIDPAFLEEQRRIMGPRMYMQEYECEFAESIDQYFPSEVVAAAFDSGEEALFDGG